MTAVARRHGSRIGYYEVWNEPNDPNFGKGTIARLVELTRGTRQVLDSVDPAARVITPAAYSVGWLDAFLAAGGGRWSDVVGYHIDNGRPEDDVLPLANLLAREFLVDLGWGASRFAG